MEILPSVAFWTSRDKSRGNECHPFSPALAFIFISHRVRLFSSSFANSRPRTFSDKKKLRKVPCAIPGITASLHDTTSKTLCLGVTLFLCEAGCALREFQSKYCLLSFRAKPKPKLSSPNFVSAATYCLYCCQQQRLTPLIQNR